MKYVLLLSLQLFLSGQMVAQSGMLDSTFDNDGITRTNINSSNIAANDVAIQPDGKIVVTGYTGVDFLAFSTIRYNQDGSLDPGFGINGIVITKVGTFVDYAMSILIQPDNKILVLGSSTTADIFSRLAVVRYLENGLPDSSFGADGIVLPGAGNASVEGIDMVLQADGNSNF